jgi:hypothetical protein
MSPSDESLFLHEHLIFHPRTGKLDFVFEGEAVLANFSASLTYTVAGERRQLAFTPGAFAYKVEPDGLEISQADEHVLLTCRVRLADQLEMWLEARNLGALPVQVERLNVLEMNAGRRRPAEPGRGPPALERVPERLAVLVAGLRPPPERLHPHRARQRTVRPLSSARMGTPTPAGKSAVNGSL